MSPVEEVRIQKQHVDHLIDDNEPNRRGFLNYAIATIERPNLIIKNGKKNDYLKFFWVNDAVKPHLQIVKVASDGVFYVTNFRPTKNQVNKIIKEGQIIYDLSNVQNINSADINNILQQNEFVNQDFRDGHRAPSSDGTPVEQRLEDGGDFSLAEVAKGQHNQPNDYFGTTGPRMYGYDTLAGHQSHTAIDNIIRAVKAGKTGLTIMAYRAVPADLPINALINGDWISFSEQYVIEHGEHRFGEGNYKIIKQEVPITDVWWDGNDINEWGYDNGKTTNQLNQRRPANGYYDPELQALVLGKTWNETTIVHELPIRQL